MRTAIFVIRIHHRWSWKYANLTKADREYDVMDAASELFKGHGSIEYLQMMIEEYLKADDRKRIVVDSIKR